MEISDNGLEHLIGLEGYSTKAYRDSKGLYTIGVGHLILPSEEYLITTELTHKQVMQLLRSDLHIAEHAVNRFVQVHLTQEQYDALVSVTFNIGTHGFESSTFLKRLNAGQSKERVAEAILYWNKPSELIERREKEVKLFLS